MATVFDFAARIQARLGQVDRFRLNKLVYYVQARSLVHRDQPAFDARIEAWTNGPVVRDLWTDMQHNRSRSIEAAKPLPDEDAEVVDQVLFHYGRMTGPELIDLTHDEAPWRLARGSLPPHVSSTNEVSLDSIRTYYTCAWREAREDNEAITSEPAFTGSIDALVQHLGT